MAMDILIVDDEQDITGIISDLLEDNGYDVRSVNNGKSAILEVVRNKPDIVLLDIWLGDPEFDGIVVLKEILKIHPDLVVVMMSGHGTVETAVNAMKAGAFDFIEKPFKSDHLLVVMQKAADLVKTKITLGNLESALPKESGFVAKSPKMSAIYNEVKKIAPTNARVLISGPVGSGKERLAKEMHSLSLRKDGAFLRVDCIDLNDDNFEQMFYGYYSEETGIKHPGILDRAHRGTLCLNEIADLSPNIQGKLLNILGSSSFLRPGSDIKSELDVRVISTTRLDPKALVNSGKLREDLYYRLGINIIELPSLAERKEDIKVFVDCFVNEICVAQGKKKVTLSPEVYAILEYSPWEGNIRQLKNVIDWLITVNGKVDEEVLITTAMLPKTILDPNNKDINDNSRKKAIDINDDSIVNLKLREARNEFEKLYIKSQMDRFGGNISQTASFIGMERSALHRKLKALELDSINDEDAEAS